MTEDGLLKYLEELKKVTDSSQIDMNKVIEPEERIAKAKTEISRDLVSRFYLKGSYFESEHDKNSKPKTETIDTEIFGDLGSEDYEE